MSEHTPGPWDCWDMDEFGWHVFATKFGDRKQGQNYRLSVAAVRYGRSHSDKAANYYECVANARLIAAAPDLLAAILNSDDAHWTPAMRAAIAKATGQGSGA